MSSRLLNQVGLESFVLCEHCRTDISGGGHHAVSRHINLNKHILSVKANESSFSISKYYSCSYDQSQSVICLEVVFTKFLLGNNLPLVVSDKFNKIVSTIFSDSEIEKNINVTLLKQLQLPTPLPKTGYWALLNH